MPRRHHGALTIIYNNNCNNNDNNNNNNKVLNTARAIDGLSSPGHEFITLWVNLTRLYASKRKGIISSTFLLTGLLQCGTVYQSHNVVIYFH